jgi:hypothetical protein
MLVPRIRQLWPSSAEVCGLAGSGRSSVISIEYAVADVVEATASDSVVTAATALDAKSTLLSFVS